MTALISRDELARHVDEGTVLLIEALSSDFYLAGHLPGAVNLPLSSSDDALRRAVLHVTTSVVVYGSRTGDEAYELAGRISSISAGPVLVYEGGKEDWVEAGLPVEWAS